MYDVLQDVSAEVLVRTRQADGTYIETWIPLRGVFAAYLMYQQGLNRQAEQAGYGSGAVDEQPRAPDLADSE